MMNDQIYQGGLKQLVFFYSQSGQSRFQNRICIILNKHYFTYFYSMSLKDQLIDQSSKRQRSLRQLGQLFSQIEFLELCQKDFATDDLHQLSILTEYNIHPVFSSKELHKFYQKLANEYWINYQRLKNLNNNQIKQNRQSIIQIDTSSDIKSTKSTENHQIHQNCNLNSSNQQIQSDLKDSFKLQPTEAFVQETKQSCLEFKVTKTYHQINKFFLQFDYDYAFQNQNITPKIQLLNSWTSIPSKLPNFTQKKISDTPKKMDSATYLQNIKFGKLNKKQLTAIQPNRTIILGKNESTQTKQIKHILKVQAKTNFVDQKQKEEQKLDILQKKSIQLNYLLNVITKQFFGDFFNDILKILRQNSGCIVILCDKVIQKVKQEHNFIPIYVELIRKLCKCSLYKTDQTEKEIKPEGKFNELQLFFVSNLQSNFINLISRPILQSTSNFNECRFQKQIIGMSRFIGQLIKEKVLSKKIFKVCFWQIVYRYVQKVKQNSQNYIVNECLIESIVIISDSIGNTEMAKLMDKQKESDLKQSDQVIQVNKFQQMIMALVSPNDQDSMQRQKLYDSLIEQIKVSEYPHILAGLSQIFVSKRMKLKFLVQNWQNKLENISNSSLQDNDKNQQAYFKNQSATIVEQLSQQNFIQMNFELKQFIKQIKKDVNINRISHQKSLENAQLTRYSQLVKEYFASQPSEQNNQKALKQFTVEFLKEFADSTNYNTVQNRVFYFIGFVRQLIIKNPYQIILDLVCEEELQNLMIIQCDYCFLIEGVCILISQLLREVKVQQWELLEKMKVSFDWQDEDMREFYDKVKFCLQKMGCYQFSVKPIN